MRVVEQCHVDNKSAGRSHGEMLDRIDNMVSSFLRQHRPSVFVRERGFTRFARETQSIFKVVGIADMALYRYNASVFYEIAPLSVKKLVTGSGKSSKAEVATALEKHVGDREYACDDESDSIAVGIAWLIQEGYLDTY